MKSREYGAAVAQRTVNPLVVGSNPTTPAELGFPCFRNSDLENKVVLQALWEGSRAVKWA